MSDAWSPPGVVDFDATVLKASMDAFGESFLVTPVKSQPAALAYQARGSWDVKHLQILLEDGAALTTRTLKLGIRISEFPIVPRQGDIVSLPADDGLTIFNGVNGAGAPCVVNLLIDDVKHDGQGGAYLILKMIKQGP